MGSKKWEVGMKRSRSLESQLPTSASHFRLRLTSYFYFPLHPSHFRTSDFKRQTSNFPSSAPQDRRHDLYRLKQVAEPEVLVLLVLIVVEVDRRHEDRRKAQGIDERRNRDRPAERPKPHRRGAEGVPDAVGDALDLRNRAATSGTRWWTSPRQLSPQSSSASRARCRWARRRRGSSPAPARAHAPSRRGRRDAFP